MCSIYIYWTSTALVWGALLFLAFRALCIYFNIRAVLALGLDIQGPLVLSFNTCRCRRLEHSTGTVDFFNTGYKRESRILCHGEIAAFFPRNLENYATGKLRLSSYINFINIIQDQQVPACPETPPLRNKIFKWHSVPTEYSHFAYICSTALLLIWAPSSALFNISIALMDFRTSALAASYRQHRWQCKFEPSKRK